MHNFWSVGCALGKCTIFVFLFDFIYLFFLLVANVCLAMCVCVCARNVCDMGDGDGGCRASARERKVDDLIVKIKIVCDVVKGILSIACYFFADCLLGEYSLFHALTQRCNVANGILH